MHNGRYRISFVVLFDYNSWWFLNLQSCSGGRVWFDWKIFNKETQPSQGTDGKMRSKFLVRDIFMTDLDLDGKFTMELQQIANDFLPHPSSYLQPSTNSHKIRYGLVDWQLCGQIFGSRLWWRCFMRCHFLLIFLIHNSLEELHTKIFPKPKYIIKFIPRVNDEIYYTCKMLCRNGCEDRKKPYFKFIHPESSL